MWVEFLLLYYISPGLFYTGCSWAINGMWLLGGIVAAIGFKRDA